MRIIKPCLILTVLLLAGIDVSACWCRHISACQATNNSSAIFTGKVLKITSSDLVEDGSVSSSPRKTILLSIDENFLGTRTKTIQIQTGYESDCDYFPFQMNQKYLVYASADEDGKLWTGLCGGTKEFEGAAKDLEYLRGLPNGSNIGGISGDLHGVTFDSILNDYKGSFLSGFPILITGNGVNEIIHTRTDGSFEIKGLKAGDYRVKAFLPAYYGSKYRDNGLVQDFKLNGRGCAVSHFYMDVANSIKGRVLNADGKPVANIEVFLTPAERRDDDTEDDALSAYTDENGQYSFAYVFPRTYLLGTNVPIAANPNEGTLFFYPGTEKRSNAKAISFGLGQAVTGYDLVLPK